MIILKCDECGLAAPDPSRVVRLKNLCTPSGIMMARDFEFCCSDCYWAWCRKFLRLVPNKAAHR